MPDIVLEIVEGPSAGRQVTVRDAVEIGRDLSVALPIDDELVSRRHARVEPHDGGVVVSDLESRNGTFLNGQEVQVPTRAQAGDQIGIGTSVIEIRTAADVAARPTSIRPRPSAFAQPPKPPDYVPRAVVQETELDYLLDRRTKSLARTAPLAILILVVFALMIFFAVR